MSSTVARSPADSSARSSGPLDQERLAEDVRARARGDRRRPSGVGSSDVRGLEQPDLEQLPRVVPLVYRVTDVETLVALQPDQLGVERRRERLGDLGLADAGLAFEKEGAAQRERQEDRDRQPAVGDVLLGRERLLQLVDRGWRLPASCASPARSISAPAPGQWRPRARRTRAATPRRYSADAKMSPMTSSPSSPRCAPPPREPSPRSPFDPRAQPRATSAASDTAPGRRRRCARRCRRRSRRYTRGRADHRVPRGRVRELGVRGARARRERWNQHCRRSSPPVPKAPLPSGPRRSRPPGTMRVPPGPAISIEASSATSTVGRSAPGSACARLPPIVPRLRTAGSPILAAASRDDRAVCAHLLRGRELGVRGHGADPQAVAGSR